MAEKRNTTSFTMWSKPDFNNVVRTHKSYRSNYNAAMLYAHYEMSSIDLKKEAIKYLKKHVHLNDLLTLAKDLHDNRFTTIGKYFFVLNGGGELPEDVEHRVIPTLKTIVNEEQSRLARIKAAEAKGTERKAAPTATIHDRVIERAKCVAAEIDGWIDDFSNDRKVSPKTVEDFSALFKTNDIKPPHVAYIRNCFERRFREYQAVGGDDKFINEAYSCFSKIDMRRLVTMMTNLYTACDMVAEVARAARVPKIPKPKSAEKLIAKLVVKKEDTALGIVSVNPVTLIGASIAWVYNTRTRKLAHYKAQDGGFSVKGMYLTNFTDQSVEKTLRKPAEILARFKKDTKIKLRTFMDEITSLATRANGKITEHHVILRVDK